MAEITLTDYLLLPFYLWLIYKIAYFYRNKYYPRGHPYHTYFIPGLTVKIAGAISIGLIYNYYYSGGDTFNFFYHSQIINSTFMRSPHAWFSLITHRVDGNNLVASKALSDMYWYDDIPAYTTSCIGAFIGIFCFTKYLVINVIVASLSFIGSWLLFVQFARQYPNLVKYIAIAVLFMPGPVIWGSGLFKDSFCLFAIGCLVYCIYVLFERREFKISLVLLLSVSVMLLILIKAYILIILLPLVFLKTLLVYRKQLSNYYESRLPYYIVMAIITISLFFIVRRVSHRVSAEAVQTTLETIKRQKDYLLQVSLLSDGSAYDLGDFDPTLGSILSKFWPAVNVTLFRPFVWESRSIMEFFNSFESLGMLLLTLYLLVRRNIFKTVKNIITDPTLIMCLLFVLAFSFIVGVSTYNFGSLSRYRIPGTPFFMVFVLVLLFKDRPAPASATVAGNEVAVEVQPGS
ncbi:hypothetical protein [Mucilaginibacter sp.]|jgi:hypothetical protein|uniref:hypothetical protein n=1 Tax=Mucilaginibacter sp. TaxID=1882438 RepID=UPI002CD67DC9|nr:hypothetical protein [Mucilaginibacter sp.]HTI60192.1 hypothetical protein [Mucilaginibacter sp.]